MNTVVPVQQHPKESLHWLQRRTSYRGHRHALHPCYDQITLPPSAILEQTSPTCKLNHHKCMRCKGCEHILEATAPSIISRKAHYEGKNEFTLWNLLDFFFTNTIHYQFNSVCWWKMWSNDLQWRGWGYTTTGTEKEKTLQENPWVSCPKVIIYIHCSTVVP